MKTAKKPMLPPFLMKGADKAKAGMKGKAKKYAKGGGVEAKGKTKGRMV